MCPETSAPAPTPASSRLAEPESRRPAPKSRRTVVGSQGLQIGQAEGGLDLEHVARLAASGDRRRAERVR
jgi:hypothetical protein